MANILHRVINILIRFGETRGSDALVGDALVGHIVVVFLKKNKPLGLVYVVSLGVRQQKNISK
jgi:hypothetical protein